MQVTSGGVSSTTVYIVVQVAVLSLLSVAVNVISNAPTSILLDAGGDWTSLMTSQLSLEIPISGRTASQFSFAVTVLSEMHVTSGGMLSTTVMPVEQDAVLSLLSVAMYVILVEPKETGVFGTGVCSPVAAQLSVALPMSGSLALQNSSTSRTVLAMQVTSGGELSTTVRTVSQDTVLSLLSVTVYWIFVSPRLATSFCPGD
mmetsp:Transcript_14466/g.20162  ORF Transcript_14466/g.20162 Transcript_14466/m.20162 type:complete len:202 (-) Transcript_14466:103-708(-)